MKKITLAVSLFLSSRCDEYSWLFRPQRLLPRNEMAALGVARSGVVRSLSFGPMKSNR